MTGRQTQRRRSPAVRLLRWAGTLLLLGLAFLLLLVLCRNPILKAIAQNRIRSQTGLQTEIGSLQLNLSARSLALSNITIHNPPGFGDSSLLNIPELFLSLSPANPAEPGTLAFNEIRLHLGSLNLVRNTRGQLNLQQINLDPDPASDHPDQPGNPPPNQPRFGGIETFSLTLGNLNYIDLASPENNRQLHLNVNQAVAHNLHTREQLTAWCVSLLARIALQHYLTEPAQSRQWLELVDKSTPN